MTLIFNTTSPNKGADCTGTVGWMQIEEKGPAAAGGSNMLPSSTCIGYVEPAKTD
jgi:hypothetical protein